MQAVIELVVTLVAALATAAFAHLGLGSGSQRADGPPAQRVVARSPQAKPPTPQHTEGCPEAATPRVNLV